MKLAEKIIELRQARGWSQEDLVEHLDVSGQSVAQWESGQATPDLAQIVELSRLFGVSTDYLLRDNTDRPVQEPLTHQKHETEYHEPTLKALTIDQAQAYIAAKEKSSRWVALGVSLCVLSPTLLFACLALAEWPPIDFNENLGLSIGVPFILVVVAVAVILFIRSHVLLEAYKYVENEVFMLEDQALELAEQKSAEFQSHHSWSIAAGVAFFILSPAGLIIAGILEKDHETYVFLALILLLFMVAIGLYLIVRSSIQKNAYHALLQVEEYSPQDKTNRPVMDVITNMYWAAVTFIYLIYSFFTFNWDVSWIIWPVAALLFGILSILLDWVFSSRSGKS